ARGFRAKKSGGRAAAALLAAWNLLRLVVLGVVVQAQSRVGILRGALRALRRLLNLRVRLGALAGQAVSDCGNLGLYGPPEGAVDADGSDGDQRHDDDVLGHALAALLAAGRALADIETVHGQILRKCGLG